MFFQSCFFYSENAVGNKKKQRILVSDAVFRSCGVQGEKERRELPFSSSKMKQKSTTAKPILSVANETKKERKANIRTRVRCKFP